MEQVDLSGIGYFLPVLSFLIVWAISFAVINKSKLIEQKVLQIFVSFVIGTLFISVAGPSEYIVNVSAWFAVFLVSLFLLMLLMGLTGDSLKSWHAPIGKIFIVFVFLMFLVSAVIIFSEHLSPFMPWGYGDVTGDAGKITGWFYSGKVIGAILLLVVSGLAAWMLSKAK